MHLQQIYKTFQSRKHCFKSSFKFLFVNYPFKRPWKMHQMMKVRRLNKKNCSNLFQSNLPLRRAVTQVLPLHPLLPQVIPLPPPVRRHGQWSLLYPPPTQTHLSLWWWPPTHSTFHLYTPCCPSLCPVISGFGPYIQEGLCPITRTSVGLVGLNAEIKLQFESKLPFIQGPLQCSALHFLNPLPRLNPSFSRWCWSLQL